MRFFSPLVIFVTVSWAMLSLMVITSVNAQYGGGTSLDASASFENPVKLALREGKIAIGATVTTTDPDVARTLAGAGYEFLWIEMEHSPLTLESVRGIMLGMQGQIAVPFTRVPWHEPWLAKRVLDIGSLGVIWPMIRTRDEAEQAVKACKYPPEGIRGMGAGNAASLWDVRNYTSWANDNIMVVIQIETPEGVANIEEIAAVPGIDVLFIGATDLSSTSGLGRNDPAYQALVNKVIATAQKNNISLGWPSGNADQINRLVEQGFQFFQASDEKGLMRAGARSSLSGIRRP